MPVYLPGDGTPGIGSGGHLLEIGHGKADVAEDVFHGDAAVLVEGSKSSSDVLIEENPVSVGVHHNKTGGARRLLIGLIHDLYALRLQLPL